MITPNKSINYIKAIALFSLLNIASCSYISGDRKQQSSPQNSSKIVNIIMETSLGEVEIALFHSQAPITVSNFLRYIDSGSYTNGNFYRVVRKDNDNGNPKITVIQGDVADTKQQFDPIAFESTKQTGILHLDGTLSMARLGPDTATSAFFICVGPQPALDFGGKRNPDLQGFAAFGRVTKGMEIVRKINQSRDAKATEDPYLAGQMLKHPVVILSMQRKN